MKHEQKTEISIFTTVNAPVEKVCKVWTTPEDIIKRNSASEDWHTQRRMSQRLMNKQL
jgi:uncharacterized protein YndB with AHSA1/START domain